MSTPLHPSGLAPGTVQTTEPSLLARQWQRAGLLVGGLLVIGLAALWFG
jgi:hypothetical protein